MYDAYRVRFPEEVEARRHSARHRRELHVPGPNALWSLDGNDKLKQWGIEIYACIDAFSRYIVWCYVGITNKTAVSVLAQFLQAVDEYGFTASKIRTDKGVETGLLGAAQHQLAKSLDPDVQIGQVFRRGKSTTNTRIERWWGELMEKVSHTWIVGARCESTAMNRSNLCYRTFSRGWSATASSTPTERSI